MVWERPKYSPKYSFVLRGETVFVLSKYRKEEDKNEAVKPLVSILGSKLF